MELKIILQSINLNPSMKRVLKIFFLLLISFELCVAQIKPGARQAALSFSDLSSSDVFSLFYNPSTLSNISNSTIGISYSPSPFGLKELSTAYLSYIQPIEFGVISAGFMIYGFELYKETQFAIGLSKSLSNNFSFGVTSILKNISIKNYGSRAFLLFNLGCKAELTKNLNLGFVFENFTRTTINNEENQFPVTLNLGVNYSPIDNINFFTALVKELNYNISLKLGAEYKILDYLSLRVGTTNQPEEFSAGFGFSYDFISIEYAVISHQDLGLTHQFGLVIQLK